MTQTEFQFTEDRRLKQVAKRMLILDMLRAGPCRSSELKEVTHRFSACIRNLREEGHIITVSNDNDAVHALAGFVKMIEVTDELKRAYYLTPHWMTVSASRREFDGMRCCHCRSTNVLQVHHWIYDLFNESMEDLVTLCRQCHERLHQYGQVKIHFPHYVTPDIAERIERRHEEWFSAVAVHSHWQRSDGV